MEDSSVHVTSLKLLDGSKVYAAMPTRSASMRVLADGTYCLESSTLAMSNSEELYAGKCCIRVLSAWHIHVVNGNCFVILTLNQRPNSAIILEGRPEPDLLAMVPFS